MSQTVIIENDEIRYQLYSLNLFVYLGTDILRKFYLEELIQLLKVHPSISLILCPEDMVIGLKEFFESSKKTIPLLPLSTNKAPLSHEEVLKKASELLGKTFEDVLERPVSELVSIPISSLMYMNQTISDLYLRMPGVKGGYRFIKRFTSGDILSIGVLRRYIAYGENYLYIPSQDRVAVIENLSRVLKDQLKRKDDDKSEHPILIEHSMQVVAFKIQNLVFDEETYELSEAASISMKKLLKDNITLDGLFKNMLMNKSGLYFQLSQLTLFVAKHILKTMDWWGPQHLEKMSIVVFFHDLLLYSEQDKDCVMMHIRSEEDWKNSSLKLDEKNLVLKHAYLGSEILKKCPKASPDLEQIIKQHHGALGGIGFPSEISGNLSNLSLIFFIAEEFVYKFIAQMKQSGVVNPKMIIEDLKKKFIKSPLSFKLNSYLDSLASMEVTSKR